MCAAGKLFEQHADLVARPGEGRDIAADTEHASIGGENHAADAVILVALYGGIEKGLAEFEIDSVAGIRADENDAGNRAVAFEQQFR